MAELERKQVKAAVAPFLGSGFTTHQIRAQLTLHFGQPVPYELVRELEQELRLEGKGRG